MERKEKVELILEQMRLCLATKDYIRAQIISKKISTRFFENTEYQQLKLTFYQYMIELDQHEGTYLNICKHYRAVLDTPCIKEDKALNKIPKYKGLLEEFTNLELIAQKEFSKNYEADLKADVPGVFDDSTELGKSRWGDLKKRVFEHNIRIMATYHTKISLKRMSFLLSLTEAEAEDFLSTMVVNKTVEAKTDRLDGIVDFTKHQDPNDMLNNWSHSISELLSLVMKTTHLVNKEEMVHKHMMGGLGQKQPAAE